MSEFIILVYDVQQQRTTKVLKICRKYLHWIQNSVFEGEISQANKQKLLDELQSVIDPDYDSIIIFTFRRKAYTKREIIGREKGNTSFIV